MIKLGSRFPQNVGEGWNGLKSAFSLCVNRASIVSVGCFVKGENMKQPNNNAAIYMRLSRDDENYGDSVSIETQRTILTQFVKENGFHVVDEYVDM